MVLGDYAGFDESQPTSVSGGKKVIVQRLKDEFGYKNLVMIGDGATDMEACPPAVSVNHNSLIGQNKGIPFFPSADWMVKSRVFPFSLLLIGWSKEGDSLFPFS